MRNRTLELHVDSGRPPTSLAHGLAAETKATVACGGSGAPIFPVGELMSFGNDRTRFVRHAPAAS